MAQPARPSKIEQMAAALVAMARGEDTVRPLFEVYMGTVSAAVAPTPYGHPVVPTTQGLPVWPAWWRIHLRATGAVACTIQQEQGKPLVLPLSGTVGTPPFTLKGSSGQLYLTIPAGTGGGITVAYIVYAIAGLPPESAI